MREVYFEPWVQFALRRRVVMIEVAVVIMAVVAAATFLWPPIYKSTAEILVQDNRAQLLVSPALENNAPNQPAVVANAVTEEDLNSERELISSDYLIQQALDGLPLPKPEAGSMLVAAVESILDAAERALRSAPRRWRRRPARAMGASGRAAFLLVRHQALQRDRDQLSPRTIRNGRTIFCARLIDKYLEFHSSMSHDPQAEHFFQQQAGLLQGAPARGRGPVARIPGAERSHQSL